MNTQYAGLVRDVVVAQLDDPSRGFNVQLAATSAAAGVPAFTIDWSATSLNFLEAQVDPIDLEETSTFKYPLATLAITSEVNRLNQTFITFSGDVPVELTFYLSFKKSSIPRNVEKTISALTAAVIRTFCDPSAAGTANFTGPVTFDRKIQIRRSFQIGGQNWRAAIKCNMTFGLDSN